MRRSDLNMTQRLVLVWLTVLSVTLVACLAFFWTTVVHGLVCSNSNETLLGRGQMLTFTATRANVTITWVAKEPTTDLIANSEDHLVLMKDGYYFLSLQVTLTSCSGTPTVKLRRDDEVLLEGAIDPDSCSTGLLAKVDALYAGLQLVVAIHPPNDDVILEESRTHLDVIFMPRMA